MRLTALAFLVISFVVYWLFLNEMPLDQPAALGPVSPSIFQLLPEAPKAGTSANQQIQDLRRWLNYEARQVRDTRNIPTRTVIRLKARAMSMAIPQLNAAAQLALDLTLPTDARLLAVYVIGLSESAHANQTLSEIGHSPIPSTLGNLMYSNEKNLRKLALDNLAKREAAKSK